MNPLKIVAINDKGQKYTYEKKELKNCSIFDKMERKFTI